MQWSAGIKFAFELSRKVKDFIGSHLVRRNRIIMEITAKNFEEKLPLIESSIDEAVFVSIDGEFTGLSCKENAFAALDTAEERYIKAQRTASQFMLIQVDTLRFNSTKHSTLHYHLFFSLASAHFTTTAKVKRIRTGHSTFTFFQSQFPGTQTESILGKHSTLKVVIKSIVLTKFIL
jgi:hypothetical protein